MWEVWFEDGNGKKMRLCNQGEVKGCVTGNYKAVVGLVGKKKGKNNGEGLVAVVDTGSIKGSSSLWRRGVKGVVRIAKEEGNGGGKKFKDDEREVAWKLLGIEGEKIVGYMVVAPWRPGWMRQGPKNKESELKSLTVDKLVKKGEDKPICQHRALKLRKALEHDFKVEWRATGAKIGILSPKAYFTSGRNNVFKNTGGSCADLAYFGVASAYFWFKDRSKENTQGVFHEEKNGTREKILKVNDTIKSVIYDNVEEI